jgi:hypothetical protein
VVGLSLDATRDETVGKAATFKFDPDHKAFSRAAGWQDTFDDLRLRPRSAASASTSGARKYRSARSHLSRCACPTDAIGLHGAAQYQRFAIAWPQE